MQVTVRVDFPPRFRAVYLLAISVFALCPLLPIINQSLCLSHSKSKKDLLQENQN